LNGWASSHVTFDVFRRVAYGFAAALDILVGSFNGVTADQSSDRH